MLNRTYDDQDCSIARTLEILGERWTLLIVRDIFNGSRRFDQLQDGLGIARNVLATRLGRLIEEGVIEKRAYRERPVRHEYFLTEKGLDLWPVLIAMLAWGDRYATPGRPADGDSPQGLRRDRRRARELHRLRRTADRKGRLHGAIFIARRDSRLSVLPHYHRRSCEPR